MGFFDRHGRLFPDPAPPSPEEENALTVFGEQMILL